MIYSGDISTMETVFKLISLCLLFYLINSHNGGCKCDRETTRRRGLRNMTAIGKRQLPDLEDDSVDGYNLDISDMSADFISRAFPTRKDLRRVKNDGESKMGLNETHVELNKTKFHIKNKIKGVCPFYQRAPELTVHKMAGLWELAYYKATEETMFCFKMRIERVPKESRKALRALYSTFNDTIDWRECHLQVSSVDKEGKPELKHFLMGPALNEGAILENIVLTETIENDTKTITLQEESPDQWMLYKNLLLMRDCDLGSLLVFSHVPTDADAKDAERALRMFGEENVIDMNSCLDKRYQFNTEPTYRYVKYNILS